MARFGRWPRRILWASLAAAGMAALAAGLYWTADGAIKADVVEKSCRPVGPSAITVETRWFDLRRVVPLEYADCALIPPGAFVEHHIRSGRSLVFEHEGGRCLWDTATGGPCR